MPFASVAIKGLPIGTLTNKDGYFKLSYSFTKDAIIAISCLGYKTNLDNFNNIKNRHEFQLVPDTVNINEVIIMPDSVLHLFLKRAFKNIEKNYSLSPVIYEGFYRETLKQNEDQYIYFSEAMINLFKDSYNKINDGQVKILKSRKNVFPGSDTVNNVQFYAGPYLGITKDFVYQRESFINPKRFKNYHYQLEEIKKLDNREVYKIKFDTNNDSLDGEYNGYFLIDKNSLAYCGAEYQLTKRGITNINFLNVTNFKELTKQVKVVYSFYNGYWHLIFASQSGTAENKKYKTDLSFTDEFMTIGIKVDSVKPIPYNEQLGFGEIFLTKATVYDNSFWKDYNILPEDSALMKGSLLAFSNEESKIQLTKKYNQKKSKFKLTNTISHFYYQLNLETYNVSNNFMGSYTLNYTINNKLNTFNANYNANKTFAYNFLIGYNLNKAFGIYIYSSDAVVQNEILQNTGLGLSFKKNIKPKGHPLFLVSSLSFSSNSLGFLLGKYLNNTGFNAGGEKFNSSTVLLYGVNNFYSIIPEAGFKYKFSRAFSLVSSAKYYIPFNQTTSIHLEDNDGFIFTRSQASVSINNNNISLTKNNQKLSNLKFMKNNFTFCIGFELSLE